MTLKEVWKSIDRPAFLSLGQTFLLVAVGMLFGGLLGSHKTGQPVNGWVLCGSTITLLLALFFYYVGLTRPRR